jgi:hypothetical protein
MIVDGYKQPRKHTSDISAFTSPKGQPSSESNKLSRLVGTNLLSHLLKALCGRFDEKNILGIS